MDSVESVVVWFSASTVTHTPARPAASQIDHAFSRAIFSPSRSSDCPSADSLTETSSGRTPSPAGSPRRPSVLDQVQVGLHGRIGVVGIADVLAQVVDADVAARRTQGGNAIQRGADRLARDEAVHHFTGDGQPFGGAAQSVTPAGGHDRRPKRVGEYAGHQSDPMCG